MKILPQQGNNAAFNDNKRNQQSTQLFFECALISVALTLFRSHETIEMLYLTQLKKNSILALI